MSLMRKVLLAGSTSPLLREQATKRAFVRKSVSGFMPGETIDEALDAAAALQAGAHHDDPHRLGENLTKLDEAEEVTAHYLDVLDSVKRGRPRRADFREADAARARSRRRAVPAKSRSHRASRRNRLGNIPVWIDMESSPYVDPHVEALSRQHGRSREGVGMAMQAYLYRTAKDIESLIPLGPAIRIVKGAYLEPPDVAFPKKSDVDENFYKLCLG